jgi:ADP-heptose:LPS heptosyltransferase
VASGVLIIHPGALGDVLQAVPALRALRERTAGALVFAGQPRLGRLLVALGVVDDARGFDGLGLETLFTDAPASAPLADFLARFARVVSWFGSREPTYRVRLAALAPDLVIAPPVPDDDTPVWRHLVATLGRWGLDAPAPVTPLRLRGPAPAREALIVHPGSGGAWKRWPAACFAQVIRAVGPGRLIVHQGPADAAAVEALVAELAVPVERLVEPDLPALAVVLADARAYLGGDSGVSHLAAAVGAPSVILFPPEAARRWRPWSPTAIPVELSGDAGADAGAVRRALEGALSSASR